MFLLLPSVIQNIFLAEQSVGFFVVKNRNFCVTVVTRLMQEDRKSILLKLSQFFLYFSENGWVYDVHMQVCIF